jgi:hypothetical protein
MSKSGNEMLPLLGIDLTIFADQLKHLPASVNWNGVSEN